MEENFNTHIESKTITDAECNHDWLYRRSYIVDKKDVCQVYTCVKCKSTIITKTENLFSYFKTMNK
jgi:hypothetical protein